MTGRDRFGQWSYSEERGLAEIGAVSEPRYLNEGRWQDMTPDFFDTGRMSGRFIDPAWLGEKRALYTVSPPSVL